jgi:adenylate cyclase
MRLAGGDERGAGDPLGGSRQGALRRRAITLVTVISLLVGLTLYLTDALHETELDTIDTRFEVRGTQDPPDDLVVVNVDDQTFRELKLRWPFPRSEHAKLLDRLAAEGPAAIAFDVQFTEPTIPPKKGIPSAFAWASSPEDVALIKAVRRADNVVLSTTEVGPNGETAVLGGNLILKDAGAEAGNTNLPPDTGGVLRRLPYSIDGLKTLAVATTEAATGEPVDPGEFDSDETLIDYKGPPGTIDSISYSDVIQGEFDPGFFTDKIVVIGASAPSLQDVHPTSTTGEELMSGPEIQANAIETVRDGIPLEPSSPALDLILIVLMSAAVPLASLRLSAIRALIAGVLLAIVYVAITQLAFNAGLVLPVIYPLATLTVALVGMIAVQYVLSTFEREQVRSVFARFVPEGVVSEVMARSGDDLRLGGETQEVTILFSDVRGFTTFSETRPAEEVLEVLNRYLEEMSDAILAHGGAITAYIGDGIMAVFGAPIEQPDHADRALAAARSMLLEKLPAFNGWLQEEKGLPPFRMGIGLQSGPVMAGNVGSDRRMEYTAIGDTVNTASRLEGMTKGTPYSLYVADPTRELLAEAAALTYVDEVEVRGRKSGVKVWTLPDTAEH